MADISANQRRLDEKTHEALQSVHENNLQLLEQQQALANSHAAARATMDSNMRALLNEKALIKSGQAEVMGLVKKLMDKLEMASNQLDEQMEQRAINHKEILNDINVIHENAEDVWLKIEQSTTYLTDQNLLIIKQYEKTLDQLKNINFTINYLGKVLDQTKSEIDKKLSWLNDAFEGTGYTLDCIYLGMLYFLLMTILMIICAFFNLSKNSRFIVVAIVMINMVLENREEKIANILPMDLKELCFTIVFVLFGRSVLMAAVNKYNRMVKNETKEQSLTDNSFFAGALENHRTNLKHSSTHYKCTDANKNICNETLPTINKAERDHFNATSRIFERESSAETEIAPLFNVSDYSDMMGTPCDFTPPVSRTGYNSSHLRSNTPSSVNGSRKLCDAKTRKGDACKNFAQVGHDFCIRHRIGSSIIGDL